MSHPSQQRHVSHRPSDNRNPRHSHPSVGGPEPATSPYPVQHPQHPSHRSRPTGPYQQVPRQNAFSNYPLSSSNAFRDERKFPHLPQNPSVTLPGNPPTASCTSSDHYQIQQGPDLEGRMRDMILQHQPQTGPATQQQKVSQPNASQVRPQRRANQATRKQQQLETQQIIHQPQAANGQNQAQRNIHGAQHPGHRNYRQAPPPELPQSGNFGNHVPPHLRGQNYANVPSTAPGPPSALGPHHRQLFDPYKNTQANQNFIPNGRHYTTIPQSLANIQDQIEYLEFTARNEISRIEISVEEYQEKHKLRAKLEVLCREAIHDFEKDKNPDFDAESVHLEVFGSLKTTFATKNSDMDVAVLSPNSQTDASSIDSPLPRVVERKLLDAGYGARLLTRTRVPIIKFCEEPTPELANDLREERMKWEEEMRTPKEKAKKPKRKSKRDVKNPEVGHIDEEDDRHNPTMPQFRPNAGGEHSEDDDHGNCDEQDHEATEDEQNAKDLTQTKANGSILDITNGEEVINERGNPADTTNHPESKEEAQEPRSDLERDDPTLANKTDEERIRLYELAIREEWYTYPERQIIHHFIRSVKNSTPPDNLDPARGALQTLPNVLRRYRERTPSKLDYPKTGVGLQCDINFSNLLAIHNSTLLRCYSICNPRVKPMVLFIKSWAKKRKINSAYEGTLSSYGYVLLVLHYLVNIAKPPVLPNLQHVKNISSDPLSMSIGEVSGYDVRFFRNEASIAEMASRNQITSNYEPLGSLLRGFFTYYGSSGHHSFQWTQHALSLRTQGGLIPKNQKGWTAAKTEVVEAGPAGKDGKAGEKKDIRQRYLVAIEDPFEIEHNVGRTVNHEGICAIRDEMRRANFLVCHAGVGRDGPEQLCGEHEGRGNLQYRYFGPRPRRGIVGKGTGEVKEVGGVKKSEGRSDAEKARVVELKAKVEGVAKSAAAAPTAK